MLTNIALEEKGRELKIPLVGVYNKDVLPHSYQDGGYVINLQDSVDENGNSLPGTHWTTCYCEKDKAAYFDSFGFAPPVQVHRYLLKKYNVYISEKQIQSIRSEICGYYALYFIYYMYHHRKVAFAKRFRNFLGQFSDNPLKNKTLLEKYIKPI